MFKFKKKQNKGVVIAIILGIIIIILLLFIVFRKQNLVKNDKPFINNEIIPSQHIINKPEFVSKNEQADLGIPAKYKVQAISREANGDLSVYKIINNDGDIISDPSKIGPLSPHKASSTKK